MLIPDDLDMELDEFVERYETAHAEHPGVDVADFMPSQQHARYAQIGCELLRVHMELSANVGRLISAEEYRQRFPEVCRQSQLFAALQAEEERVRANSRSSSPSQSSIPANQTNNSKTTTNQTVAMPRSGQCVSGFQLVTELGRGAFSQVFLAQDDSLSQRRVVLKISSKLLGEADLLSRLQHKNIVPVYSLHKYGQYHLICMPFLGTMTLADMLSAQPKSSSALSGKALISTLAAQASRTWKEDESVDPSATAIADSCEVPLDRGLSSQLAAEVSRMSTTELALWIVSELADGLAHAHQRGVLHRDIKPANILLSDDGLPMLLDFNLAASTRTDDRSHQVVGGTLRYMSPEQLRAVQTQRSSLDARADLFSLGVVLYELLHRRAPYVDRTGSWEDVLAQMLADRKSLPAMNVQWREGLTPAVLSILSRALAFDPAERYQSASEFRDDLRAHLQARPLSSAKDRSLRERVRKWNTRHPRLSSMTIAAALTAVMLSGTVAWTISRQAQLSRLQAMQWLSELEHAQSGARTLLASEYAPTSTIENWLLQSSAVLTVDVEEQLRRLPAADAARARACLGRLHLYRARGAIGMLDREEETQKAHWLESARNELLQTQRYEKSDLAASWQKYLQTMDSQSTDATPHRTGEAHLVSAKHVSETTAQLRVDRATLERELASALATADVEASNPWHWIGVGQIQLSLGKIEPASASFMLGHNLANREPLPAFFLGLVEMKRRNFHAAEDWFTFTLAQDPTCWEAWMNRAATRVEQSDLQGAIDDIQAMGDKADHYPRAWFIREMAESRLGKRQDAERSRNRGLQLTPNDAAAWNARGQAKLRTKPVDAASALDDFQMAIRLDPQLRNAYENAAHVLSERLDQPQAAIDRLSDVLLIDPEYALAWSSRAVLNARQGNFNAAVDDVEHALRLDRSPMICYQCASALALREAVEANDDKDSAGESRAEPTLTSLHLLKETLRKDPALSRFMRKDQDLSSLLNNPQFQELISAAARLE